MSLAIVGSSGGMKGVFVQGVLNAFETGGLYADAYAGASASALPVLSAAAKLCNFVQYHYWQRVQQMLAQDGVDLSDVMYAVIHAWDSPDEPFKDALFQPDTARLLVPANFVNNPAAAQQTQTEQSRKLGRKLLLSTRRNDRTWVDENLDLHLFDTHGDRHKLTAENVTDVSFASTRMIQWRKAATIKGQPYVDASYTCAFPVEEVITLGYEQVIAISTEVGTAYRDIFAQEIIPAQMNGVPIQMIRPAFELTSVGVDYASCTADGLLAAFQHGEEQGRAFLEMWRG